MGGKNIGLTSGRHKEAVGVAKPRAITPTSFIQPPLPFENPIEHGNSWGEQEIGQGFYLLLKTFKCKLGHTHGTVVTNDFSAYRPFRSSYAVLDQRTRPDGGGKITSYGHHVARQNIFLIKINCYDRQMTCSDWWF